MVNSSEGLEVVNKEMVPNIRIWGKQKLKCLKCQKILTSYRKLRDHYYEDHDKDFKCLQKDCDFFTKDNNELRMHSRAKHRLKCNWNGCEANLTNAHSLRAHLWSHNRDPPFKCEECGQEFTDRTKLEKHLSRYCEEK